jgi:hypothetical protein
MNAVGKPQENYLAVVSSLLINRCLDRGEYALNSIESDSN